MLCRRMLLALVFSVAQIALAMEPNGLGEEKIRATRNVQTSPRSLIDMPRDILQKICAYSSGVDRDALSETCQFFNVLIWQIRNNIVIHPQPGEVPSTLLIKISKAAERIFSVRFENIGHNPDACLALLPYLKTDVMRKVTLNFEDSQSFPGRPFFEALSRFQNLKEIKTLGQSEFTCVAKRLSWRFPHLTHLTLSSLLPLETKNKVGDYVLSQSPNLEFLSLNAPLNQAQTIALATLLPQWQQLKQLKLHSPSSCVAIDIQCALVKAIVTSSTQDLHFLSCDSTGFFPSIASRLPNLGTLKALRLELKTTILGPIFQLPSLPKLEQLDLLGLWRPEVQRHFWQTMIVKFPNLKHLGVAVNFGYLKNLSLSTQEIFLRGIPAYPSLSLTLYGLSPQAMDTLVAKMEDWRESLTCLHIDFLGTIPDYYHTN